MQDLISSLISRQAAIDAMNTRLEDIKLTWRGKVKKGEIAMYLDMRGVIETLPSAQPERKKGKWHRRFYPQIEMMVCSECQEEFSYDAETGIRDYNYCPNCGADMRPTERDSNV